MKTRMFTLFLCICCLLTVNGFAQYRQLETVEREPEKEAHGGFQKDHLFVGGNLNLGFGSGFTALGIAPFFGYSFNKYLDVAVSPGISYTSQRDVYSFNDKLRQTIYGPGAFVRIFPVKFLFAQAQYEFNLIRQKYIPPSDFGTPNERLKKDAHSFLIGGGFAGGRNEDNKSFYYFSVMWDVAKSNYSPYRDNARRSVPIIRAGYNIALFQGR